MRVFPRTLATDNGPLEVRENECEHMSLAYDDKAQTIECLTCKKFLPAYAAFKHTLHLMDKMQWQKRDMDQRRERDRQKQLRMQPTCGHQLAKKMRFRGCDRCGMMLDGKHEPGSKVFEQLWGRWTEVPALSERPALSLTEKTA